MIIREFLPTDISAVKKFTDKAVGLGYYSESELSDFQKRSLSKTKDISSFVLVEPKTGSIYGIRLAFPPGNWEHGKGSNLRPDLWPTQLSETAYFQSLFVDPSLQGQGWGPKLSEKSLEVFKKAGAKGVVTHCWKESPHNTSFKYLDKIGFKTIIEHPDYWMNIDYVCTRDGKPCRCTAIEMHLSL